ncbi:MAG: lysophospholipase, partial [Bacteroidota bacterium]|nr:lysophospholipase [Bacteroidota bacterium]
MNNEHLTLLSRDGLEIHARYWVPEKPNAIICIVHGIGEHSGRYNEMALYMCSRGFTVFANDQRGHGKSGGKRGHSPSYSLLLDDVETLMKWARSQYPDLPLYLYGHSWGGNIVANFILKRKTKEVSGSILSSPWLELQMSIAP